MAAIGKCTVLLGLLLTALAPDQTALMSRPFDGAPERFVNWMLSFTGGF